MGDDTPVDMTVAEPALTSLPLDRPAGVLKRQRSVTFAEPPSFEVASEQALKLDGYLRPFQPVLRARYGPASCASHHR